MKTILISAFLCLITAVSAGAQAKTDTLYYDKNWKGVESMDFATYYRIIPKSSDSQFGKRFRTFYITGEVQAEGQYVSIDKYNDKKSVFDDEVVTYYKSGNVESKSNYEAGKLEGEREEYTEDGVFCSKYEYKGGNLVNDYYVVERTDNMMTTRISIATGKPVPETPTLDDRKFQYRDGEAWTYYSMNGVEIGMTNKEVKDYGKYYQLPICITNNTVTEVDFDPDKMTATVEDNKGKISNIKVLTSADYMKKVDRSQGWSKTWNSLAESFAAMDAGNTTATSTTKYSGTVQQNSSQTYGRHHRDTQSNRVTESGKVTTETRVHDGAAAYDAYITADERIEAYNQKLDNERDEKNANYLKHTTIKPGESIAGYINIERKKGEILTVVMDVDGTKYTFPWDISKKK